MSQTINQRVSSFAHGKLGQQVGSGECWDLADQALKNAGAKSSADLGPMGPDDDYVWGDVIDLNKVHTGDILQFRDYSETTSVEKDITFADGAESDETADDTIDRPHHTAVVEAVLGHGVLRVLEQNVDPGGRKVQRNLIPTLSSASDPTTTHAFTRDAFGKMQMATIVTTTTVSVSGRIVAYHPIRK